MRNIRINEAESIFEPFWDSGDSYPDNHKYSCLKNYEVDAEGKGSVGTAWMCVSVNVNGGCSVSMKRNASLDVSEYDIFRFFGAVSGKLKFIINIVIDGKKQKVIESMGHDSSMEYNGEIKGKSISEIEFIFENNTADTFEAKLLWLGLSNKAKEAEMLARKTPYDAQWEGCFRDEPEIIPQDAIYFDENELQDLRKKLSKEPFLSMYEILRKEARDAIDIVPENEIGTYVIKQFVRFLRTRDVGRVNLVDKMKKLAFVGIVDNNMQMCRLACRMALSVCHCTYFCESIMGVFPGATWHHRSFTEEDICKSLVKVLDWCGGLLTWHGKNIIYDSIIMKGLPRLDADIKTMDYIWYMNQGTAFVSSLVIILIALAKRYPRYAIRIDEAERDMLKMWDNYILPDGGAAEGPEYWNFTISQMIEALYLLARYKNSDVGEYTPESVKRTAKYAMAILSDNGDRYVPINDAHIDHLLSGIVMNFLADALPDGIWKARANRALGEKPETTERLIEFLIFAKERECDCNAEPNEFISLPYAGITALHRKTEDCGKISLYAVSGAVTFGHGHGDKGSFVIEVDGSPMIIDRGICGYENPLVNKLSKSEYHNTLCAVSETGFKSQSIDDDKFSAAVTLSEYRNGVLSYETDTTASWNGIFEYNTRKIESNDAHVYLITDNFKTADGEEVCFILNTNDEAEIDEDGIYIRNDKYEIRISSAGCEAYKTVAEECLQDGMGDRVNRICMYYRDTDIIKTKLEIKKL